MTARPTALTGPPSLGWRAVQMALELRVPGAEFTSALQNFASQLEALMKYERRNGFCALPREENGLFGTKKPYLHTPYVNYIGSVSAQSSGISSQSPF